MKIKIICDYIAKQLNTRVSFYSSSRTQEEVYLPSPGYIDPFISHARIADFLLPEDPKDEPTVCMINGCIAYFRFSRENGCFLIGPCRILSYSDTSQAKNALTVSDLPKESFLVLHGCIMREFLTASLLLYNILHEAPIDLADVFRMNFSSGNFQEIARQKTTSTLFANRETQTLHSSYDREQQLMNSIATGNLEQLKKYQESSSFESLGITAKDPVRNGKNLAIFVINSAARAAIRGGVQQELALSMGDSYVLLVEDLKDMSLLENMVIEIQTDFAKMVYEIKKEKSGYAAVSGIPAIEDCKKYIFMHLHGRLSVQEIAQELHIHPNYLSNLFHQQEGISLYRYILLQKIELVKNLLTYSSYSFLDIANYLGFTSQSHLGKHFKAITGMTLKQYREKYRRDEF